MKNRDIMDEDYGSDIDEKPKRWQPQTEETWGGTIASIVIAACLTTIVVALTLRLDRWILG